VRLGARAFFRGRVEVVTGVLVEAVGVPAAIGELVRIQRSRGRTREPDVDAEVIGFRGSTTLLMPHGDLSGIAPSLPVVALGRPFAVPTGPALLGRVVDGFAQPIDGREGFAQRSLRSVRSPAQGPLERVPIAEPLATGIRALDGFATLGKGQRIGVFAGSGVGKSTLLGEIARASRADVCVVALVGERGREVRAFLDDVLGAEGLQKAVVVASTSDRPPIERFLAPFTAVTIAEAFRDLGQDVLLVLDSVTRFATAAREIGLAAGEPPTVRGYPPSFFAALPKLVERMGRVRAGSITGILSVLVDGDDVHDPLADAVRGLLDGHVVLSRDLAQRGHYPAIDVLQSLSRLMPQVAPPSALAHAARLRELLAAWRDGRDLIEIGAYKPGSNPALDRAVALAPEIDLFLRQPPRAPSALERTRAELARIAAAAEAGR
jgi:FliI/YscN family ATPase